jgi:hypothetical protein
MAYLADCHAAWAFDARESAARAITDVAHEHPTFSRREIRERACGQDWFISRAITSIMERAERMGGVRAVGKDRWEVVDEETLYDAAYGRAA